MSMFPSPDSSLVVSVSSSKRFKPKLAKLSTEFNSKLNRLIIKIDKKTVLEEILINETNIKTLFW